jgi:hypothetical protein
MTRSFLCFLVGCFGLLMSHSATAGLLCRLPKHREVVIGWYEDTTRPRLNVDPVGVWALEVVYDDQGDRSTKNALHARALGLAKCQSAAPKDRKCYEYFSWDIDQPDDSPCAVIYYATWETANAKGEKYVVTEVDASLWPQNLVGDGFAWARSRRDNGGKDGVYRRDKVIGFASTSNCGYAAPQS